MSKVFFGGRVYTTPVTASAINDSAMRNQGVSVGNLGVLIGASAGGKPKAALRFGSPQEARDTLVSGELLDAVLAAFDPSQEVGGPAVVMAMRATPATQSTLALYNGAGAAELINLTSVGYGLRENQVTVKVEAGTNVGKRVTVARGTASYVGDDLTRRLLTVQYTGTQATATVTVNGGTMTLAAPAGTSVVTIDLSTYTTVQDVVARINAVTDWTASVASGQGDRGSLTLDTVAAVSAKTARALDADLQAVIDWFNSNAQPLVTAARAVNSTSHANGLANISTTYLAGATEPAMVNEDWTDCFTELQRQDVQWVCPVSSSAAIHAMADAHVQYMSTVGRKERRAVVGTASGTTDAAAIAAAAAIASDRTSLVHLGHYDYDVTGTLVLYPPYISAARVVGMFCAVAPGTPLTNKLFKCRGLERNLRNPTDTDVLIDGGVFCLESTELGYKVVQSITTWLANDNYNKVEQSTGWALDYTARNVRTAVDVLRGQKVTPILLSRAISITDGVLRELARPEPQGPEVIVGYRNILASADGDVVRVQFECQPVIGANFVLVTIYAVPYSGAATA